MARCDVVESCIPKKVPKSTPHTLADAMRPHFSKPRPAARPGLKFLGLFCRRGYVDGAHGTQSCFFPGPGARIPGPSLDWPHVVQSLSVAADVLCAGHSSLGPPARNLPALAVGAINGVWLREHQLLFHGKALHSPWPASFGEIEFRTIGRTPGTSRNVWLEIQRASRESDLRHK